jgi:hypothetical protein
MKIIAALSAIVSAALIAVCIKALLKMRKEKKELNNKWLEKYNYQ